MTNQNNHFFTTFIIDLANLPNCDEIAAYFIFSTVLLALIVAASFFANKSKKDIAESRLTASKKINQYFQYFCKLL